MSSESSHSERRVPVCEPSVGIQRKIDFDEHDLAASLPPKRPKDRWYSPMKMCRSIPRLDTTLRPRRLINERVPNFFQTRAAQGVVMKTPRVKQIPSPPILPDTAVIRIDSSASIPNNLRSMTASPTLSPPPFRQGKCVNSKKKLSSLVESITNAQCRCSGTSGSELCGLAMQLMFDRIIALEEDRRKPMCPCIDSDYCMYTKHDVQFSAVMSRKSSGVPTLRQPRAPVLPPRRSVVADGLSAQELNDITEFNDWIYSNDPNLAPGLWVPVPNKEVPGVRMEWFFGLFIGDEWLNDEHMDSIMLLLALEHKTIDQPWGHNWTCLETRCWHAMIGNAFENVIDLVGPYANGFAPRLVGRNWRNIQTLYGVGFIDEHWILYQVSLPQSRITVYDSSYTRASWCRIQSAFISFACNLGRLLRISDGYDLLPAPPQFEVVRYRYAPQQVNENDCGVMVLEYFRALVNGQQVEHVIPGESQEIRMKYCAKLFKFHEGPFHGLHVI